MEEQEIWKDVQGYEGLYQVSSLGRVKSLKRYVRCPRNGENAKRIVPEIILKSAIRNNYLCIELFINGIGTMFSIHRLVAIAFIPNPENKPEVNHLFGNKLDNRASMLEWATKSENQKHAFINGLKKPVKGENHYNSKLTNNQVIEIRKKYLFRKYTTIMLGKEYNTSRQSISDIINNKTYRNV